MRLLPGIALGCGSDQAQRRQSFSGDQTPAQASSSTKNAGPSIELSNAYALLISQVGPAVFFL